MRVVNGEKFGTDGRTTKQITISFNAVGDSAFISIEPVPGEKGHLQQWKFDLSELLCAFLAGVNKNDDFQMLVGPQTHTYCIGPFVTREEAEAHLKKYPDPELFIRKVIRP